MRELNAGLCTNTAILSGNVIVAFEVAKENTERFNVLEEKADGIRKQLRGAMTAIGPGVQLIGRGLVCGVDVDVAYVVKSAYTMDGGSKAGKRKEVSRDVFVPYARAAQTLQSLLAGAGQEIVEDVDVAVLTPLHDFAWGKDLDGGVDPPVSGVGLLGIDVATKILQRVVALVRVGRIVNGGAFEPARFVAEKGVLELIVLVEAEEQLLCKVSEKDRCDLNRAKVEQSFHVPVLCHGHVVVDGPVGELLGGEVVKGGPDAVVVEQSEVGLRDDGRAASLLGVVEAREEQQRLLTLVCFSDADVGNTMEADVSGLCVLCTRSANGYLFKRSDGLALTGVG